MPRTKASSGRTERVREKLLNSQLTILQGIPEEKRRSLIQNALILYKREGSVIFWEGSAVKNVWIIVKGQVKLANTDPEGHEQIVGIFSDMEVIWESLFLPDSCYPYSGVCMSSVILCGITIADYRHVLEDPNVSFHLITLLSAKLHDANQRNTILSRKSPEGKIARLLLYYSDRTGKKILHLKLTDIAGSLNLRPETVSRKIGGLIDDGILSRAGRGKIEILDRKKLKKLAGQ